MKQLVKTSLIFLLLFSFQNLGFGQGSFVLKGQIMDGAYKEPLMAAAVSIKGKASGTATDLDGKFEFEIAKKYWNDTLVISMLGYTAQKMTVREAMVLPNHYFETTLEETSFNLEMAEIGAPIILNNIFFDFNRHKLLPTSFMELEKLYNFLKKNDAVVIEIAGHTDSIGTDIYNEALSEARASSVMAYLEEKGIVQNRMTAKGYGETRPVVSNFTEAGQAMNRRVEFTVMSKGEVVNASQMPDTTRKISILEIPEILDNNGTIVLIPPILGAEIDEGAGSGNGGTITPINLSSENEIMNSKPANKPITLTLPINIDNSTKAGNLQTISKNYSENKGFNGAILIYQNGKILYSDGIGFSDLSRTKPNTLKTKFYLGSMSEQFTASLILKAVKSNRLDLSLPINKFLDGLPEHIGNKVTVLQLLSHTSGLCETNTADLSDLDLCFLPNGPKNYSSVNYILLGKILEGIYDDNYNGIIEAQVLLPLGLKNTKIVMPMFKDEKLAKGYRRDGGRLEEVIAQSPYHEAAANGIITSIEDLAKWQKALKNPNWLAPDLQILMETPTESNETLIGEIQQVVMGTKVLEVSFSETTMNGHKTLVIKTLSGNTLVIIASNIETTNLQPLYRDILKALFIE